MPNIANAYDTIMGQFATQMGTLRPLVPIAWPNTRFDPSTQFVPATHQAWARITLLGGEGRIASSGSPGTRRWRHVGLVVVQVFAPLGGGAGGALEIADDVATALQGVSIDGVTLQASSIRPIGTDETGAWYQVNVETPYRYDLLETQEGVSLSFSLLEFGTWQDPLILGGDGGYYLWWDETTGCRREKSGSAPTSETDGTEVGMGGVV